LLSNSCSQIPLHSQRQRVDLKYLSLSSHVARVADSDLFISVLIAPVIRSLHIVAIDTTVVMSTNAYLLFHTFPKSCHMIYLTVYLTVLKTYRGAHTKRSTEGVVKAEFVRRISAIRYSLPPLF